MNVRKVTHVVDCGTNKSTIYTVATKSVKTITHAEVLNLPEVLPKNSLVVAEYSHLGCERTEFSLSQPYTRDLLLDLYRRFDKNEIKLRLFPQKSTPRACAYSGLPKSDDNDPESIYLLLKDFPEISLMNPPTSFDLHPKRKESYEYKDYTNLYINMARREQPKYTSDECSKFIRNNIEEIVSRLSDTAKDVFGITVINKKKEVKENRFTRDTVNGRKGEFKFDSAGGIKMQAIYAVACTIIDPDGNLRTRPSTGAMAGWAYIKRYIFCRSPFHLKGGVARSNLYYHGLKNWVIAKAKENHGLTLRGKSRGGFWEDDGKTKKPNTQFTKEEDRVFVTYRKMYCDCIRELWQTVRDITGKFDGTIITDGRITLTRLVR